MLPLSLIELAHRSREIIGYSSILLGIARMQVQP